MERVDLRKLNNDELYTTRKQVVRLKRMGYRGAVIEETIRVMVREDNPICVTYCVVMSNIAIPLYINNNRW